jgi:hypothetical protein
MAAERKGKKKSCEKEITETDGGCSRIRLKFILSTQKNTQKL